MSGDFYKLNLAFFPRAWSAKLYGFADLSKSNYALFRQRLVPRGTSRFARSCNVGLCSHHTI